MSPATSPMSSRTAFTLLEAIYSHELSSHTPYSLGGVVLHLLQLLSLESLLSSGSNAFPRSLHGNCPFLLVKREDKNGEEKWSSVGHNGYNLTLIFYRISRGTHRFHIFSSNSYYLKNVLIEIELLFRFRSIEILVYELVLLFS